MERTPALVWEPRLSRITTSPGFNALRIALLEQMKQNQPIGKLLVSLGFVTEATIRDTLSESLGQIAIDLTAIAAVPHETIDRINILKATHAAIRAVNDRKPVWTVLPQYGGKVPSRQELRCMVWLAVASGANGVGIGACRNTALPHD